MPSYVEYNSNNSGGRWWLTDADWHALEKAGWKVKWHTLDCAYDHKGDHIYETDGTPVLVPRTRQLADTNGRWLGSLASVAYKPGATDLLAAAGEWERVTGKCATDAGCPCCGQPHRFTLYLDGEYVESGPNTSYQASW